MNNGKVYSFWKLYKEGKILIPKIQRDYVQGRNNTQVNKNRKNLVKALISALCSNGEDKNIMLNFIYGYNDRNNFIPIDGQQRLTTLFLLHIYVFKMAEKDSELGRADALNFSYETRSSTDRFFKSLVEKFNPKNIATSVEDIEKNKSIVAENIQNSEWFAHGYLTDPSVISCIAVLEEIHKVFYDELYKTFGEESLNTEKQSVFWQDKYNKLKSEGACPITFMLLDIKNEIGKPNELYIRMNSRGKQLTAFENFKADIYGYLELQDKDLKNGLSQNVDGNWLEYVWALASDKANQKQFGDKDKEELAKVYADRFYRDIFHWIIMTGLITKLNGTFDEKDNVLKDWVNQQKADFVDEIYLDDYIEFAKKYCCNNCEEVDEKIIASLKDIYYTFSILNAVKDDDYCKYVLDTVLSYGRDKKKKFTSSIMTYPSRLILFAVTIYGRKTDGTAKNIDNFKAWLRIVRNLVVNSEINKPSDFYKICMGFESLQEYADDIVNHLDSLDELKKTALKDYMVSEEKFKQQIINTNPDLKDFIIDAEQIKYFDGEILFLFNLCGIKSGTDVVGENQKIKFKNNVEVAKELEEVIREDNLLQRALLTYRDSELKQFKMPYKFQVSEYNSIYGYYVYNEAHHEKDIRGLIRPEFKGGVITDNENCSNERFVELMGEYYNRRYEVNETKLTLKGFIDKKINSFKLDSDNTDDELELDYCLVENKLMFEFMKKYGYIFHNKNSDEGDNEYIENYLLMKNSRRDVSAMIEFKVFALAISLNDPNIELDTLIKDITTQSDYKSIYTYKTANNKSLKIWYERNNKHPNGEFIIEENGQEKTTNCHAVKIMKRYLKNNYQN